MKLQPFAPAVAALDPVDIGGARLQIVQTHLMEQRRAVLVVQADAGAFDLMRRLGQLRAIEGRSQLQLAGLLAGIGAECNGHFPSRIGPGGQHDTVGQACGGIRRAGGVGQWRGRLCRGAVDHGKKREGQ